MPLTGSQGGPAQEEALKAATIYAAEHLGIENRVVSRAGEGYDLAIWDGDPLDAGAASGIPSSTGDGLSA